MCFSWTGVRPLKLGLACIRSRTLHSRRAGINMRSVETGPLCSCMLCEFFAIYVRQSSSVSDRNVRPAGHSTSQSTMRLWGTVAVSYHVLAHQLV